MRLKSVLLLLAAAGSALAGCAGVAPENNLTGDFLVGRFAERSNSVSDAAAAYLKAHARAPQHPGILRDAFFYQLAAGNIDKAASLARELQNTGADADDGLAEITLAALALKTGQLKQARAAITGEINTRFLKSAAFLINVWIEDGLSGPEAALAKLDNPDSDIFTGFNALHKAFLSEQAGRLDDARAAYQASALGLGDPISRLGYGAFLERLGDGAAASEYYGLLKAHPGPMRRAGEAGLARIGNGEASSLYARVSPPEGAAVALYAFAAALIQQSADQRMRAEQAGFNVGEPQFNYPLALARLALYLKPDFAEARRLIGTVLNIYGEPGAAAAVLAQIPPSSPHFEQAQIEIASGLTASGQEKTALQVLRKAIKRDPGALEMRWTLATLYAGEGQHERAVKTLNSVIGSLGAAPDADAWRYFVSRGASLIELGQWKKAESDLKRAVEIAPDEPTALNYLGYSWAERGVHLEEAFRLIEKAVELQPESGAIVDSLGWAHYQLGHYQEAVKHLEKAAALEPGDPTVTEHLGDVYWRLGRKIEARYQWRRSLELDPGPKLAASLRAKLKSGLAPLADDDNPGRQ